MDTIYLDNCATTPCDPEIAAAMTSYFCVEFGNPSSVHMMGKRARRAMSEAAFQVATAIGAEPEEIVFTSGATESNNLALFGSFDYHERAPVSAILSPIDHKSTLYVGKELERRGIAVRHLEVGFDGRVRIKELREQLDEHVRIVSLALVNSELGVIQPVEEIAQLCRTHDVLLHVDAVQAMGKLSINVQRMGIDLLSISAHKIYGPKGIGALYVSASVAHRLRPLLHGGEQHRLRSGTLATPLIIGMGMAVQRAVATIEENHARAVVLRDFFIRQLLESVPDAGLNTCLEVSVPHILNIRLPGVSSEALVTGLRRVAISSGSACNSSSLEPSYVLQAIGLTREQANSSIRICFNPHMRLEMLETALRYLIEKIHDIRCVGTSA